MSLVRRASVSCCCLTAALLLHTVLRKRAIRQGVMLFEGRPLVSQGAYGDAGSERLIKLGGLADHLATIKRGRRIIFVACGTSFHACLAARQTVEELADIPGAYPLVPKTFVYLPIVNDQAFSRSAFVDI